MISERPPEDWPSPRRKPRRRRGREEGGDGSGGNGGDSSGGEGTSAAPKREGRAWGRSCRRCGSGGEGRAWGRRLDEFVIGQGKAKKEHKINAYRGRAAERRILHRGLGIGPGQMQINSINSDEYEDTSENMDSVRAASVDMNFCSSGLNSAQRILENMGWKEGEALGKSRKGIVEPIQPTINKHGAGLGWNQTR